MGSGVKRIKHYLGSSKERRLLRKSRYNPSHDYGETEYTLINDSDDDNGNDGYSLRPRSTELYFDKELKPGDTLQSLSLQFNCPIAELKRINGILRENEIFARKTLKIPIKPGSVLTELVASVHANGKKDEETLLIDFDQPLPSNDSLPEVSRLNPDNSTDLLSTDNTPSCTGLLNSSDTVNSNSKTEPNELPSVSLNENIGDNESSSPLLLQHVPRESSIYSCSGADWGMKWPQLLICSLILGFAGPIIWVLYVAEKKQNVER